MVRAGAGEPALLYIDLHLVHEVTSPQAFEALRLAGRGVRRPDLTVATMDHNVPTWERSRPVTDEIARQQMETLAENCREFGIILYDLDSDKQGIVHVIGPELGLTQPGMTIVCGDSHTSTHGALGALAFGIGTSEVEHVLATQCLQQARPRTMEVRVDGRLAPGVTAKDVMLGIIGRIGIAGGTGYVVEYTGEAIRALSMEGRMTVCNMTIEGGARAGMVAPDDTTFAYLEGRPHAPQGKAFERAVESWRHLPTDPGASYDRTEVFDRRRAGPLRHLGHEPGDGRPGHRPGARPGGLRRGGGPPGDGAGPGVHGPDRRHGDRGHPHRPRLPRLLHQRAHRGPARRRRRGAGQAGQPQRLRHGRAGLDAGQGAGRAGGAATGSSPPPASTGARPAARCAWG